MTSESDGLPCTPFVNDDGVVCGKEQDIIQNRDHSYMWKVPETTITL